MKLLFILCRSCRLNTTFWHPNVVIHITVNSIKWFLRKIAELVATKFSPCHSHFAFFFLVKQHAKHNSEVGCLCGFCKCRILFDWILKFSEHFLIQKIICSFHIYNLFFPIVVILSLIISDNLRVHFHSTVCFSTTVTLFPETETWKVVKKS